MPFSSSRRLLFSWDIKYWLGVFSLRNIMRGLPRDWVTLAESIIDIFAELSVSLLHSFGDIFSIYLYRIYHEGPVDNLADILIIHEGSIGVDNNRCGSWFIIHLVRWDFINVIIKIVFDIFLSNSSLFCGMSQIYYLNHVGFAQLYDVASSIWLGRVTLLDHVFVITVTNKNLWLYSSLIIIIIFLFLFDLIQIVGIWVLFRMMLRHQLRSWNPHCTFRNSRNPDIINLFAFLMIWLPCIWNSSELRTLLTCLESIAVVSSVFQGPVDAVLALRTQDHSRVISLSLNHSAWSSLVT